MKENILSKDHFKKINEDLKEINKFATFVVPISTKIVDNRKANVARRATSTLRKNILEL